MGNTLEAVTDVLEHKNVPAPPALSTLIPGTRFADGRANTDLWNSIIQEYAPFLSLGEFSPLLPHLSGALLWSMESSAQVTTLTVRTEPPENSPTNR
jgi:hypothetical protein